MDIFNLVLVALLIAFTAFFVASEFAIVKIRGSKVDQLIASGNKQALAVKKVTTNLDEYLSACQLGITITALGLGWLGEPTIEHLLHPIIIQLNLPESISTVISFAIAFAIITFLHVVIGELAPKTWAIQKAEQVTFLFANPLIWFYRIMFPFIWILNGSARIITRMFGLRLASEHELAHSEDELRIILSESYQSGEINQSEYKYVNRIFEFDNRIAKEIMIPRTEMTTISIENSLEENLAVVNSHRYTRYPVINGDKDHILGFVHVKELYKDLLRDGNHQIKIDQYIRPVIKVIESIRIHDLLLTMQKKHIHIAILLDEYGGTAGLVTVEDIIEEIVGDIRDEFDAEEHALIQKVSEDEKHYLFEGRVLVEKVNHLLGIKMDDTDIDTLSGWILNEKYDPKQGDNITYQGFTFIIKEIENHHVKLVEAKPKQK